MTTSLVPISSGRARGLSPRGGRRVLMTVDAVGGVWRYAMELSAALAAHGYEFVFAGLGPAPARHQIQEAERIGELVWLKDELDWMAGSESNLDGLPQVICQLAASRQVDLLHLNVPSQAWGLDAGLPVLVVSHSCVVTWWDTVRGSPLPQEWEWQRRRNAEGFRRADLVVAPSRSHGAALERCYGPLPHLHVVPNGVGASPAPMHKQDFAFAAGRWWDEGKNARILDEAAALAAVPVLVAGPCRGPNGQAVELQHLEACGELDHQGVLDHMSRAAIAVSPSLYEPFGLAAVEAARSRCALLLADIPTYRELWSDAAIFFDPQDAAALAEAIDLLAADTRLRTDMAMRAFRRSHAFEPSIQAQAMAELYRGLLAARLHPIAAEAS